MFSTRGSSTRGWNRPSPNRALLTAATSASWTANEGGAVPPAAAVAMWSATTPVTTRGPTASTFRVGSAASMSVIRAAAAARRVRTSAQSGAVGLAVGSQPGGGDAQVGRVGDRGQGGDHPFPRGPGGFGSGPGPPWWQAG